MYEKSIKHACIVNFKHSEDGYGHCMQLLVEQDDEDKVKRD